MKGLFKLNQSQRIIIMIALGIALAAIGEWASAITSTYGWVAIAPLTSGVGGPRAGVHLDWMLALWLGLAIIWSAMSVVVMRSPEEG